MLVLALLVPAPLLAREGCSVCPSDCPMHVPRAADTVGCHRHVGDADEPARGGRPCELRSACGHDRDASPVLDVKASSRPLGAVRPVATRTGAVPRGAPAGSDACEVPTEPPKPRPV